ncbi:MAG TPA: DUF262 domain-containing protein [Haliangium sp.]|nr:DUF262 domain-containing protein [Haliangium sp.]
MAYNAATAGARKRRTSAHGGDPQAEPRRDRGQVQHAGSEPTALARRPEAIAVAVEDLLEDVHAGRIRVPRFQRALKWKRNHVDLLLDSIYRGYPIGTLLFWKKPAEAARVQLGPVFIDAPARQDALWVVDGQQRITSLAGVLTGPYEDVTADHTLFFDLHEQSFQRASKRRRPLSHWLPLDRVVDSQALLTWLHERGEALDKSAVAAAIQLGKRVREYQVPAYVVETDDDQPLREIFARVNRGGQPLDESDVFQALHGGGEHRPSGLDELADSLRATGFGNIDRDLILKAVLAVLGKELSLGFKKQLRPDDVPDALARTQAALERVIVFLRKDVGIPHVTLLPYQLPLITLARFFHLHPEPAPRSLGLMARWLWRGAINGRHQGGTVITRRTLRSIVESESDAVQNLLRDVGSRPHAPPPLTPYRHRYAHSKLQLLALWALEPRHLDTGAALHVEELVARRGSPAQYVKEPGNHDPKAAVGLANRLLHPPLPGGLRKRLIGQSDVAILASHGVTPEARAQLAAGDFEPFLRLREETLRTHIETFLEARAQWEVSDRPPLADLIIEDED